MPERIIPRPKMKVAAKRVDGQGLFRHRQGKFVKRMPIMSRGTHILWSLLVLAACGGSPFPDAGGGGDGGTDGGTVEVPENLSRNLASATYDADRDRLSVELSLLDASPIEGTFRRNPRLDVAGYEAFTFQESATQRSFIALFRESGGVMAGAVGDGGQFSNTIAGGTYAQTGTYSRPASGLATYEGRYAGLLNLGRQTGGPLDPVTPYRTSGTVRINADFTNDAINGGVTNRKVVDRDFALDTIALEITEIKDDSTFLGRVKIDNEVVGDYGGIFGGQNASDVGVVMVFNPIPGDNELIEQGAIAIHCVDTGSKGVPCN